MSKTVSEALLDTLAAVGVTHIFGIVGDALNPLTDALRRDPRIKWMGVHHEEGAALAAAGQAKHTGRLGVCAGTTGPGGVHLLPGLYEARADHAPVLAITGQVAHKLIGNSYVQEVNQNALFEDVALYNRTVETPAMLPNLVHEAVAAALTGSGVAHLTIPQDVIGASVSGTPTSLPTLRALPELGPDPADLDAAARLLDAADSICLLVGEGCRGAVPEVLALAERLGAPVVHSFRAMDLFPHDHPQVIGGVGLIGGKAGTDAVMDADLLLMVGTDYPWVEYLPKHGRVIQVDRRAAVLGRRCPVQLGVVGSARPALAGLLTRVAAKPASKLSATAARTRTAWDAKLDALAAPDRSADTLHPQYLARAVSDAAAADAVFCVDVGTVTLWAGNWLRPTGMGRVLCSFNYESVGTALATANGVAATDPARQVIALVGDGGFGMLIGEFMTAVQHRLPVKVIVFNNRQWGLVALEMEGMGLPEFAGAELPGCDFAAHARACGAHGATVRTPAELPAALAALLATPGPGVLDVFVHPNEVPAMPHVSLDKAWHFGMAKVREAALALTGG